MPELKFGLQEAVDELRDKLVLVTGACDPSNVDILKGRHALHGHLTPWQSEACAFSCIIGLFYAANSHQPQQQQLQCTSKLLPSSSQIWHACIAILVPTRSCHAAWSAILCLWPTAICMVHKQLDAGMAWLRIGNMCLATCLALHRHLPSLLDSLPHSVAFTPSWQQAVPSLPPPPPPSLQHSIDRELTFTCKTNAHRMSGVKLWRSPDGSMDSSNEELCVAGYGYKNVHSMDEFAACHPEMVPHYVKEYKQPQGDVSWAEQPVAAVMCMEISREWHQDLQIILDLCRCGLVYRLGRPRCTCPIDCVVDGPHSPSICILRLLHEQCV